MDYLRLQNRLSRGSRQESGILVHEIGKQAGIVAIVSASVVLHDPFCEGIARHFPMAGRDNKTIFLVGNGEIAIHFFDLGDAQAYFVDGTSISNAFHGL